MVLVMLRVYWVLECMKIMKPMQRSSCFLPVLRLMVSSCLNPYLNFPLLEQLTQFCFHAWFKIDLPRFTQSSCQTTRMYVKNQSLSWLDEHIGIIKNISWHEDDHHTTSLWNLHFKQETGFLPAASWSPSLWQTSAPALIANWLHPHLSDTNTHTYTHLHISNLRHLVSDYTCA